MGLLSLRYYVDSGYVRGRMIFAKARRRNEINVPGEEYDDGDGHGDCDGEEGVPGEAVLHVVEAEVADEEAAAQLGRRRLYLPREPVFDRLRTFKRRCGCVIFASNV